MTLQYVVSGFSRTLSHLSRTVLITLAVLTMPANVFAQRPSQPRTEIGGDLRWLTGVHFNDVNANETAFGGATRTRVQKLHRIRAGGEPRGEGSREAHLVARCRRLDRTRSKPPHHEAHAGSGSLECDGVRTGHCLPARSRSRGAPCEVAQRSRRSVCVRRHRVLTTTS